METLKLKFVDVTQEVIAAWKEKYGNGRIKQIDLPKDDLNQSFLQVYARVPDRRVLSQWEKFSDKNPDQAKEILVKNCLLTDVEEVCADQDLFFCAMQAVTELIPIRKAIIKNL